MKLKCIGGPNHGQYQSVPNDYRNGELVRLIKYPEISINETISADRITVEYNYYIIETIKYNVDKNNMEEFKFLRWKTIDILEALRIVLVY